VSYTIKRAAEIAGVSVRTLHHYDHVGLLVPAGVSEAGYRLYADDDMARLQQILFYRELGFELKAIKALLDQPDHDRLEALERHRALLGGVHGRLARLITTCDRTIAALKGGPPVATEEMFDGFGDPELAEWQREAEARWGDSPAMKQSKERLKHYTAADYQRLKENGKRAMQALAELIDRPPDDPELQARIAESHRYIHETFYDCPLEMYRGLGDMYVDDPRFKANYDKFAPGLAVLVRDAIHIYVDRALKER
jgi:DNA-binding transcriptional MerR regulator